ncbi:MAG: hypothetical protein KAJ19_22790 [Gammaproteobacteria bacterium]|nr:hypothetical protein [Gammaproteobacteria bacterium]
MTNQFEVALIFQVDGDMMCRADFCLEISGLNENDLAESVERAVLNCVIGAMSASCGPQRSCSVSRRDSNGDEISDD